MAEQERSTTGFLRSYLTPAGRLAAWNLGWLMAGTGVSQVCGFVVVLLLTRAFGPEKFGLYAFAMTLHGYMAIISAAGLGPVVIRELTRRPDDIDTIATSYPAISIGARMLMATPLRTSRCQRSWRFVPDLHTPVSTRVTISCRLKCSPIEEIPPWG